MNEELQLVRQALGADGIVLHSAMPHGLYIQPPEGEVSWGEHAKNVRIVVQYTDDPTMPYNVEINEWRPPAGEGDGEENLLFSTEAKTLPELCYVLGKCVNWIQTVFHLSRKFHTL